MGDWRMKARIKCPNCLNGYVDKSPDIVCLTCDGRGFVDEEVAPTNIKKFLEPEQREYRCLCGRKEIILRPKEHQIPHGWINWSGDVLCPKCIQEVLKASVAAAFQKVAQMKED